SPTSPPSPRRRHAAANRPPPASCRWPALAHGEELEFRESGLSPAFRRETPAPVVAHKTAHAGAHATATARAVAAGRPPIHPVKGVPFPRGRRGTEGPSCRCDPRPARGGSAQVQFLEEVIALVVNDDESREILDLDLPDRLHPEFGIFVHFDLLDALFGELCSAAPDGGEVEAAVLLARVAHLRGPVTFGKRDHRAAGSLELVDIAVHPPRRRRAERSRGIALRCFRRPRVIDRMVLEIVGHPLPRLQP